MKERFLSELFDWLIVFLGALTFALWIAALYFLFPVHDLPDAKRTLDVVKMKAENVQQQGGIDR